MSDVTLVCVSDTHGRPMRPVPHGDVLLHSGDCSMTGTYDEIDSFVRWLQQQPHRLKVVIAGNHDVALDSSFYDRHWKSFHQHKEDSAAIKTLLTHPNLKTGSSKGLGYVSSGIVYLQNSGFTDKVTGLRFWGSPYSPWFGNWAFATKDKEDAAKLWSAIPKDTDILLTHGPAAGVLDTNDNGNSCGCEELTKALERVQPVLHVFGHIHESYGTAKLTTGTLAVNASTCDLAYKASQPPVVIQLSGCSTNSSTAALFGRPANQRPQVVGVNKCWD